ncbi:MAG: Dyp-type peroxidase [Micrococcaceae bacterium]|nr:Dyp-type peroxidase [Micrococcaceae bacterium]
MVPDNGTPGEGCPVSPRHPRRRSFLFGAAGAAVGAAAGAGGTAAALASEEAPEPAAGRDEDGANAGSTVGFHGNRQAGVDTTAQAHAGFVGLDLLAPKGRKHPPADDVRRLLRLLSDDASRLCAGRPPLADSEPELAVSPSNLSITFGFGPGLLDAVAPAQKPEWLRPLPAFGIDELTEEYGQTDLLLQICSDDPLALAHAQRMLLKDARSFTRLRWIQTGFRTAYGSAEEGATMRNLFGQLDGTGNPLREAREQALWGGDRIPAWTPGGTSLVLRRIAMDLDEWDRVDRPGRDFALGRHQSTGAPLTGSKEHDVPNLGATDDGGLKVISPQSHVARATAQKPGEKIVRRAYNYDDGAADSHGLPGSGLLFASYQADVDRQFLPIQRRLDESDMLNEWTTPIGSAVYAVPPGCPEGGFIGEELFG